MPKKPKKPVTAVDAIVSATAAAAGAPTEAIPEAARPDIVVHLPVMTPVARMLFTDWNTNEQSATVFAELVEDIKTNGFSGGVEVVPVPGADGQLSFLVVSGEFRVRAAILLGMKEIPASRLEHARFQDRDFQMILSIRRNNIHGRHNPEKVRKVVEQLAAKYPGSDQLQRRLSFDKAAEWKRIVSDTRKAAQAQGASPEQLAKFDEKAKGARSLADLSAIVSHLFDAHKGTVPFGYMAFSYGGKEHLYIAATGATMKAMKAIVDHCAERSKEVNAVLAPMLAAFASSLATQAEGPLPGDF